MPAAVKDLRSFLNDLRARYPDDLVSVRREVDPRREVSLLAWTLGQAGQFPVILCPKVAGSQFPIVVGLWGRRQINQLTAASCFYLATSRTPSSSSRKAAAGNDT